ncbi:MAG: MraY family glycosyltransferase [Aquisalimonadaceae bacterium]
MDSLLATITALAVSLLITPVMIRLAPRLQLLDQPNARKIHLHPVPRVGGWGITLGALAAIVLWMPIGPTAVAFIIGALILLLGGAADDSLDLPASTKLLLQAAAAVPVVVHAGLSVDALPLLDGLQLPPALAMTVTGIGLAACINATNTSDGLDGLAGGVTLLSLAGVLYLSYMAESTELLLITAASLGGLAGFLRYNTYPAAIFMGDAGSQFLGFAVGFLGLALVQPVTAGLSPWVLLLLIGLPLADLTVVASRRLLRGEHCFTADKTHIHHRLLNLGLSHNHSVILIYVIQASFVYFAVALAQSADWKILLVYALHLAIIYGFLFLAEGSLRKRRSPISSKAPTGERTPPVRPILVLAPRVVLETLVPLILLVCAALATSVPRDFGILGALVLPTLAVRLVTRKAPPSIITRIQVFMVAAAVLYLYTDQRPFISTVSRATEIGGVCAVAIVAWTTLRFSPMRRTQEFQTTAMDYLMAMIAVLTFLALYSAPAFFNTWFLLYLPVVLYGCEIIMVERRERKNWLLPATAVAAAILLVRGLFF